MITIWLEGLPLRFSADAVRRMINDHLPRALTTSTGLSPDEIAMRLAAKPAIRGMLFIMRRIMIARGDPEEYLPNPKGHDVIAYGLWWMVEVGLAMAQGTEWSAVFEEHADGLHVTDLAPRAGTAAAQPLDAGADAGRAPGGDAQAGDAADDAAALRVAR